MQPAGPIPNVHQLKRIAYIFRDLSTSICSLSHFRFLMRSSSRTEPKASTSLRQVEPERLDEVERRTGPRGQSDRCAGVPGDPRLEEGDVQHRHMVAPRAPCLAR